MGLRDVIVGLLADQRDDAVAEAKPIGFFPSPDVKFSVESEFLVYGPSQSLKLKGTDGISGLIQHEFG